MSKKNITSWENEDGTTYIGEYWMEEDGDFSRSVPDGKGKMTYPDGAIYWGDFKNGYPEGFGILKDTNGIFIGQWKEGEPHGKGKQISKEGNSWEGVYINGTLQGCLLYTSDAADE